MAVIAPNTEIYLIKSPIELDNDNQLNFANATTQHNYFSGLPKVTLTKATFQRKDGYIRWPASMESIIGYNYCMYRNKNHGNKWFYAFITDIQYSSDSSCNVYIKTDVWQTWQFDITFKKCFVEREHVNDDTFGLHTIPENLDTGDYICNGNPGYFIYAKANDTDLAPVALFQVTTTTLDQLTYPSATLGVHNGIPQGCSCFGVRVNAANVGLIRSICGAYDAAGKGDAIVSVTLVPYTVNNWTTKHPTISGVETSDNILVPADTWSNTPWVLDTIERNTTLDGYTPKNNKMFTQQFNYLYMTNNVGGDITYYWENFDDGDMDFEIASALEQGGSIKLYPINSIVSTGGDNMDGWTEGLQGAKLPALSWPSDYYLNWQAVNGTNLEIQTGIGALQWAGGVVGMMAGGQGGTGLLSFASNIANTMQQIKQAKMVPPQAKGNVSTGDINYSHARAGFTWRKMSVRAEYAKIIDDYFTMYGYKVNALKIPNITGRTYWNYVKTQGCNIVGDVPQTDIEEIKGLFNRGITIWHNPTYFLDYSQNNAIV